MQASIDDVNLTLKLRTVRGRTVHAIDKKVLQTQRVLRESADKRAGARVAATEAKLLRGLAAIVAPIQNSGVGALGRRRRLRLLGSFLQEWAAAWRMRRLLRQRLAHQLRWHGQSRRRLTIERCLATWRKDYVECCAARREQALSDRGA